MTDKRKWRVTVTDEFGQRLLWKRCTTRKLARIEARKARTFCYPTRITKTRQKFNAGIKK